MGRGQVKTFVSESPLAQKVVKEGLSKGKALAKDVAGKHALQCQVEHGEVRDAWCACLCRAN